MQNGWWNCFPSANGKEVIANEWNASGITDSLIKSLANLESLDPFESIDSDNASNISLMSFPADDLINLFVMREDFNDESDEEYCLDDHVNVDFEINDAKEKCIVSDKTM